MTIGIDGHVRTVNLAIARIEDVATLGLIPAIICAFRADRTGIISRLEKSLCNGPLVSAAALEDQYPYDRVPSFAFLPQTTGRGSICSR